MSKIWTAFMLEFKGLRIYRAQLLINLVLIPFSYVLVLALAMGIHGTDISYLSAGLIVASYIGSFVGLLSMRVSNLTQPGVMELYAAMPVRRSQVFSGLIMTYFLLSLPQVLLLIGLALWQSPSANCGLVTVGVALSCVTFAAMGMFLGSIVRNPFKAQGIFPLVSWALILFSPIYYRGQNLPSLYRGLMLVNPATHATNIIRQFLGFNQNISPAFSYVYLGSFTVIALSYAFYMIRHRTYLLEKFF